MIISSWAFIPEDYQPHIFATEVGPFVGSTFLQTNLLAMRISVIET